MQPEQITILIIDDDDFVRQTISENMRDCGYIVHEATDGEDGIRFIETRGCPHIVVTDIIMPKKEGLETIMEIRTRFPEVKLVAISGGGRTRIGDFLPMAEKMGANAVIPKPVNMIELEATIAELAKR
ncbi:MAG: response regulator [Alphaproteobacteria bacterium]|nr:response regulator [Alphaproteobacteria bacterium]MCD8570495.1 response regulator [Alphaproteobacteria bacterium]